MKDLLNLKSKIQKMTIDNIKLKEKLDDLTSKHLDAKDQIDELVKSKTELSNNVIELKQELVVLRKNNLELKETVEDVNRRKEALDDSLNLEIKSLIDENEKLKKSLDSTTTNLSSTKEFLLNLNKKKAKINNDSINTIKENISLKSKILELEEIIDKNKKEVQSLIGFLK